MSTFFNHIRQLVEQDKYEITAHAFVELNDDNLLAEDVIVGLAAAVVVEEYPDYHKGAAILVLIRDRDNGPVHALWGVPRGQSAPAFLVTAYRPDREKWSADFLKRRPQ